MFRNGLDGGAFEMGSGPEALARGCSRVSGIKDIYYDSNPRNWYAVSFAAPGVVEGKGLVRVRCGMGYERCNTSPFVLLFFALTRVPVTRIHHGAAAHPTAGRNRG